MTRSMNHVGISVANIDRSIEFYSELLGIEVSVATKPFGGIEQETILALRGASGKVATVRAPGIQIELFEFSHPSPRISDPNRPVCDHGITHFCIEVTNIETEYQRLKAAGVAFHCPPINFRNIALATYGRDPDGNVFELVELLKTQ